MDLLNELVPYVVPLLSLLIVYGLNKWLGIKIEDSKVENLLYFIINIITDVEQKHPKEKGIEKQKIVTELVEHALPEKDLSKLMKVFKTVDVAVEKAFQLSHLAKPITKLFK